MMASARSGPSLCAIGSSASAAYRAPWSPSAWMTALRKKSSPRPASPIRARCTTGSEPCEAKRADQRGADELGLFGRQRRQEHRPQRWIGRALEPAVDHLAYAIVGVGNQASHQRRRVAIVETGQQDQRAVTHVLVGSTSAPPWSTPSRRLSWGHDGSGARHRCARRSRDCRPGATAALRSTLVPGRDGRRP